MVYRRLRLRYDLSCSAMGSGGVSGEQLGAEHPSSFEPLEAVESG